MNGWEKFKIVSAVFVPATIALVGHWYTSAISEREVQSKFVELGVSILQTQPTEATTNLRSWAIEVLNKYSGVPINVATKKDLIENVPLPTSNDRPIETPLKLFCTCNADETFCFLKESGCLSINSAQACVVKYSSFHSFNISDTSKWSKYGEGWVTTNCAL